MSYAKLTFRLVVTAIFTSILWIASYGNPPVAASDLKQDVRFAKGQSALKIPFEITGGGHIFLRVSVNGSKPLLFGLDSGSEQTMISTKQAKALNLKLYGETQVTGGGENTEDFSFTKNVSFGLPNVDFKLKEVGVLSIEFSSPVAGEPIAGLLGYDFISLFTVEIDYAAQVINLYNPRSYRYRGRGESIPVKMLDNNPNIAATVLLPGLAPVKGMFVIDSGANTDIFFYSPFVKSHKLLNSSQKTTEAATEGIGGASKIRIGQATGIRIGRSIVANPSVHFSQAVKGDSAATTGAGFIGGKLLRQFKKVIFDPARRRLILETEIPQK